MPVIAASVGNAVVRNLTDPVTYFIQTPIQVNMETVKPVCVYWDEIEHDWSPAGVVTLRQSADQPSDVVACQAYHLTAFSVLLDPLQTPLHAAHAKALSIISYVGLSVSSAALVITIITYTIFRGLQRDHSGRIVLQLSLALLLLNVAFVMAAELPSRLPHSACTALGAMLHYSVVAAFCWMLVEAANMHQLIITVFASAESHFMLKRLLAAWGFPVLCVAAAVGWNVAVYDVRQTSADPSEERQICMPSDAAAPAVYYTTYLGPVCVVMALNSVVFLLVLRVLCQQRPAAATRPKRPPLTAAQIRGAVTVVSLLGITWIIGPFSIGWARLPLHYIFCLTTPLQGLIIFLVRVVQHTEAKNSWINFFRTGSVRQRPKTPQSSFHTSSSINMHSSNSAPSNGRSPKDSLTSSASSMLAGKRNLTNMTSINTLQSSSNRSSQVRKRGKVDDASFSSKISTNSNSENFIRRLFSRMKSSNTGGINDESLSSKHLQNNLQKTTNNSQNHSLNSYNNCGHDPHVANVNNLMNGIHNNSGKRKYFNDEYCASPITSRPQKPGTLDVHSNHTLFSDFIERQQYYDNLLAAKPKGESSSTPNISPTQHISNYLRRKGQRDHFPSDQLPGSAFAIDGDSRNFTYRTNSSKNMDNFNSLFPEKKTHSSYQSQFTPNEKSDELFKTPDPPAEEESPHGLDLVDPSPSPRRRVSVGSGEVHHPPSSFA